MTAKVAKVVREREMTAKVAKVVREMTAKVAKVRERDDGQGRQGEGER